MEKATIIKDALKRWEEKNGMPAVESKVIELQFQWPPIEKMDTTLSTLTRCQKLSLSTNMIEKIVGLGGMTNLKILSLSRNNIKALSGIESVGDTLEELWISYNLIEKLKGIEAMKKLKVFYVSNNLVKDWSEFNKLTGISTLLDLLFVGNPLQENLDETVYTKEVIRRLVNLKSLDGVPVVRETDE